MEDEDDKVIYKALPTLVRLTKKDYAPETRILAADTLAFLIETSPDLQRVAAISNHLIPTVASFLWWDPTSENMNSAGKSLWRVLLLHNLKIKSKI